MSKIYNLIRTLGPSAPNSFDLPEGWQLDKVVYLKETTEEEKKIGLFYTVLYVLVPEIKSEPVAIARRGRKPKVA